MEIWWHKAEEMQWRLEMCSLDALPLYSWECRSFEAVRPSFAPTLPRTQLQREDGSSDMREWVSIISFSACHIFDPSLKFDTVLTCVIKWRSRASADSVAAAEAWILLQRFSAYAAATLRHWTTMGKSIANTVQAVRAQAHAFHLKKHTFEQAVAHCRITGVLCNFLLSCLFVGTNAWRGLGANFFDTPRCGGSQNEYFCPWLEVRKPQNFLILVEKAAGIWRFDFKFIEFLFLWNDLQQARSNEIPDSELVDATFSVVKYKLWSTNETLPTIVWISCHDEHHFNPIESQVILLTFCRELPKERLTLWNLQHGLCSDCTFTLFWNTCALSIATKMLLLSAQLFSIHNCSQISIDVSIPVLRFKAWNFDVNWSV